MVGRGERESGEGVDFLIWKEVFLDSFLIKKFVFNFKDEEMNKSPSFFEC